LTTEVDTKATRILLEGSDNPLNANSRTTSVGIGFGLELGWDLNGTGRDGTGLGQ